jgi:type IV secretory pathway VirD2 relaxase
MATLFATGGPHVSHSFGHNVGADGEESLRRAYEAGVVNHLPRVEVVSLGYPREWSRWDRPPTPLPTVLPAAGTVA